MITDEQVEALRQLPPDRIASQLAELREQIATAERLNAETTELLKGPLTDATRFTLREFAADARKKLVKLRQIERAITTGPTQGGRR